MRIHSILNATGTKWTRQSGSDPNPQNFKTELKYLFGPPPGHYWLYMDVVNIELRIWAYETNCKPLIEEFESGESVHMIVARRIRPHQIEAAGGEAAWKYSDPLHKQYTATKGGTFALTYGGGEAKINATYGIPNAYDIIKSKLPGVLEYAQLLQATAKANTPFFGYPTLFTREGYPLQIPRNQPHKATSGRVQGCAGLIVQHMMTHIVKDPIYQLSGARLFSQIHDSLTFEIPDHPHSEFTNNHITSVVEAVGATHIPTCPMDPEVILPTPEKPIRLKMPTILPETINGFTVNYFFQDDIGWIAAGKRADTFKEATGPTYEQARTTFQELTQ